MSSTAQIEIKQAIKAFGHEDSEAGSRLPGDSVIRI